MHAVIREKLELARQLLDEVLDVPGGNDEPANARLTPEFLARCTKCGRDIHWAMTENGKRAALDDRPGPYALAADGTAEFEGGFGGFGYHYDGEPGGCPAQPKTDKDVDLPRREWQDVYDR